MKAYKTILFITAVFTMMGLIGYAIPADGLTVASINMTFPSPQEVMNGSIEYTDKPFVDMNQVFFGKEAILRHSPKGSIDVRLTLDDVVIERKITSGGSKVVTMPITYDISTITKELELPIFNFNEFVGQTANKLKEYFIKNILPTTDGELNWNQILSDSISDCNFEDRESIISYGMSIIKDIDGEILDQVVQANTKFKAEQSFNKSEYKKVGKPICEMTNISYLREEKL